MTSVLRLILSRGLDGVCQISLLQNYCPPTSPSIPYGIFGGQSVCIPHLMSSETQTDSLRAEYLRGFLEIHLLGKLICSFHLFIYSIIYLYHYELILYTITYNSLLFQLFCFAQIFSGLAVANSFSWLLCLFEIPPSSCCILILEHFFTVLPVQNAASSSCIFSEQS